MSLQSLAGLSLQAMRPVAMLDERPTPRRAAFNMAGLNERLGSVSPGKPGTV